MALFLSRLMPFALIFVGALGVSGCQAQGAGKAVAETKIYFDGETLVFDGSITPKSADKFAEMAQSIKFGSTLRIRSSGGDPAAALAIADIVIGKKMDVEIVDLCASACSKIFFSGENKKVWDASIVAFHFPVKSKNDVVAVSEMYRGQRFQIDVEDKEIAFFKKLGISLDIVNKADDVLQVVCIGDKSYRGPLDDGEKLTYASRYIGWVPSLYQMRLLGIKNITGYWPNSQGELDMLVKKHFAPGVKMRFVRDLSLIADKTPKLPPCVIR